MDKITVEHMNLYYGEFHALKDVELKMQEKEITAFIGPSGCGKSTLLKSLNRMNDLVNGCKITGRICLDKEDIYDKRTDVNELRKRVGMVFQKPNPFPMSIYDNIAYGPRTHGIKSKAKLDEIVETSLRSAALWDEVKDRLKKSALGLSGGQQQRVAIARTKYGVECADEVLTAAGKPALEFYDASNANKYLVDLNGTWSNTASFDYMQTILAQYNEANNNMVEVVICNNDDMALGAINALVNAGYNLPGGEGCTVIPVFGVDATEAAKELIANKQMTGSIKQDAEGMADAVATITANLIAGKDKFEGLNESYEVVDGWTVNIPYSVYTGE